MPWKSNQSQNGAITNARLTIDETRYHDDTVLISEDEDMPSEAEFAALRDTLPNDIGEGTTQGFPDGGEADSIVSENATSAHFSNKVAILSNALRYIQYLEGRKQRLRQEKTALGLKRIIYAWGMMTAIVSNYV
jgi:hypothetical protein